MSTITSHHIIEQNLPRHHPFTIIDPIRSDPPPPTTKPNSSTVIQSPPPIIGIVIVIVIVIVIFIFVYYYHYRTEALSVIVSGAATAAAAERTVVVTSIINRVVDRQQAVVHPFVDESNTYNDYDLTRQAVVQSFSLFDDDEDNSNDYEL
mmetsp:Transcript_37685/g.42445  ORF Transcript_37685/g.42445 Transcript_37685/m.42445 type:complete len:150 (-) Transcript_37685:331-780(-)